MLFQLLLLLLLSRPWGLNNFAVQRETLSLCYSTKSCTQYSRMTLDFLSLSLLSPIHLVRLQRKSYGGKGGNETSSSFRFSFSLRENVQIFFPSSVNVRASKRSFNKRVGPLGTTMAEACWGHDEHFQLTLDGQHLTLSLLLRYGRARARSFWAAVSFIDNR
jgi:hypothetical protein